MKKVVYYDNKEFLITQSEFLEAYPAWKRGDDYFCPRIDSVLTKFYTYIAPLNDHPDWQQRVYRKDNKVCLAYNKEKKEFWYAENWPPDRFEGLLKSLTSNVSYEGLIPRKLEIIEPIDEKIEKLLEATMTLDDYLDMKYKK